ncbi:MAG: mechanosensitive ion channel family protein [Rhodobacterales bacterium]|nr:mechanosensitive ion channel family protein [Rhodobacterales bacterium]
MRRLLLWLGLVLALAAVPVLAQDQTGENAPTAGEPGADLDYATWERMAERAEAQIENRNTTTDRMEEIRSQLAKWRAALQSAQNANSARIATLRQQIDALGPVPAEGETEADEISARRQELASQLVKLQAPGIAAEEAYRRADGLISEIDRTLRERQADQLLQLWPSPLNLGNWPEAAIGLADTVQRLWDETVEAWEDPKAQEEFFDNLPLIVVLVIVALALMVFVRRWIERLSERLFQGASVRGRHFWALVASLGGIVLPTLGVVLLSWAILSSGMVGEIGSQIAVILPVAGFVIFSAAWLGARVFPRLQGDNPVLPLPSERRAEGRFLSVMMGMVIGANMLRAAAMDAQSYSDATTAVMSFPILLAGGLVMMRLGWTMRRTSESDEKGASYSLRLIQIMARGLTALGLLGPVLAGFGYIQAAEAVIYPSMMTFALVSFLFIMQRLFRDIWALVTGQEEGARDALAPVLAGFVLSIASVPLLALIWGARLSDLTELWTRFTEGFQLGSTKVSPSNFMIFAIIFVIGYMLTRLFQGALRSTILPKTKMDQGGQTALVAGVGYVGIFLAALIAINAAGIDLSGLAIVAGALSVGIGFGLQQIVSNFISGIILLVERPVSEGDWIEVGGVQGKVRAISVRSTRIETFDRNDVIVPNADLITGRVTNWTRFNLSGRLIVPVSVALHSDIPTVERILREIAESQPLAILNPPPLVVLMGYTTNQLNFEIRVILRDVNFSLGVRSDINSKVIQRFRDEGISILTAPLPAEADPSKPAVSVIALADLVQDDLPPPASKRRRRKARDAGEDDAPPEPVTTTPPETEP